MCRFDHFKNLGRSDYSSLLKVDYPPVFQGFSYMGNVLQVPEVYSTTVFEASLKSYKILQASVSSGYSNFSHTSISAIGANLTSNYIKEDAHRVLIYSVSH